MDLADLLLRGHQDVDIALVAHTEQRKITALRIEALADAALPKGGPGLSAEGSFLFSRIDVSATPLDPKQPQQPVAVKLKPVAATHEKVAGSLAGTIDGDPNTGWAIGDQIGKDQKGLIGDMQTREELYDILNYHSYEKKLDELFSRSRS